MKRNIYKYEDKEYEITGKYYEKYLKETEVEIKRIYSAEESTSLMNKYIMNPYKGLVTCKEPLLGKIICETLAQFEEEFDVRLHAVCG